MRVEDRLDKDTINKLCKLCKDDYKYKKDKKTRKKHQEKLSEREIKDLMGVNRATYRRCRGALRQR